jgi:hypothetical protein
VAAHTLQRFDAAERALMSLGAPLEVVVTSDANALGAALIALQALVSSLKLQVASALGLSPSFALKVKTADEY